MELTANRPMRTVAALTTVGALALTPLAIAPPDLRAPSVVATRISTESVQLTDAWSDLLTNTVENTVQLAGLFLGFDSGAPLPNPGFPLAPIVTQFALNQLVYLGALLTGQGAQIPTAIATHLSNLANLGQGLANDLPGIVIDQLRTPLGALSAAWQTVTNSSNLLIGLLEAPAVFLDVLLNSQYGLIGFNGPIAVPIFIRNRLATAIEIPLPNVVLPFKKASGAAATTVAPRAAVTAPSGTAGSARTKPKASSSASASAKKAGATKEGSAHRGVARGKR
ncbi:hypothetical protein EV580_1791 [Mycobacterium sp. BK086]|uniref:hypothetical protein n=2 Tax=Mycobacteriaceae TaxID=1762 RepID=UPI00105FC8C4|nr:hypothetical protein [Mycobacterium sp. BK086]TDO18604.1 hypothetical protein EV580_1791 [Mycobacterium sp. BK086]